MPNAFMNSQGIVSGESGREKVMDLEHVLLSQNTRIGTYFLIRKY